mmetsp:Transcript_8206/g.21136  ORF Transcript_8206/g.21136 Transcript_8206/m.21136 type:complete len:100 (-) Transcript_8206:136-435(-)
MKVQACFLLACLVLAAALSVSEAASIRNLLQDVVGDAVQGATDGLGSWICPYGSSSDLIDAVNDSDVMPGGPFGDFFGIVVTMLGIAGETGWRQTIQAC